LFRLLFSAFRKILYRKSQQILKLPVLVFS
jgi:hypothetical protein